MKKRRTFILLFLLVAALVATVVQAGSSANYAINWDVVAKGGNAMASTNYAIQSTNSQTAIGFADSDNYQMGAGYWYGFGPVEPPPHMIYLPVVFRNLNS
jgi:hypothetical protein